MGDADLDGLARRMEPLARAGDTAVADAADLEAACREALRRFKGRAVAGPAGGQGVEPRSALDGLAFRALRYLGGDPDRTAATLRGYDHRRYGPFLGVSDEGSAAGDIRRAAYASPKARAIGRTAPLEVGTALDLERLGGVGEVAVGPNEYWEAWRECAGRILMTTNVGTRVNLRTYLPPPCVEIPPGPGRLGEVVREANRWFQRFRDTPDGRPRPCTVFVEFARATRWTGAQRRSALDRIRKGVRRAGVAVPERHRLGLCVRVGWGGGGRDAALRAIDLAKAAGLPEVMVDGVTRKRADQLVSRPGLLDALPPDCVQAVLRHAAAQGILVRPRNQVDADTVARGAWGVLNTARGMGLDLGKYGLFPLSFEDQQTVAAEVSAWFRTWAAAPVFFVDQGLLTATDVLVDGRAVEGLDAWLRMVAGKGVRVVLIDTLDKSRGLRILKEGGDPQGLLPEDEVRRLDGLAADLGIRALWAGGITLPQAYRFGRMGVFGVYVTTAAATTVRVRGRYRRDPSLAGVKEPTFEGVYRTKLLLEAGFLATRDTVEPPLRGRIEVAAEDLTAAIAASDRSEAGAAESRLAVLAEQAWRRHLAAWSPVTSR